MCIKLNPKAAEWRPTPHPPPPAAPPPPPPPPFTSTHTHPNYHGFTPYSVFSLQRQPFYYIPNFPTDHQFSYTAEPVPKYVSAPETNNRNFREQKMNFKGRGQNSPSPNVLKKGIRRVFPPRLQRAGASLNPEKKPPRVLRQEWMPKESAQPERKVSGSGGGGAARSSTFSCGDFSHSSNTTVMIKNIPNQLRRDFMLNFLDEYCEKHALEYDFLYLPMDFRKKDNLGYAFVNFTNAVAAAKFKNILQNYKWEIVHTRKGRIMSRKICEISWARIQGKEALIKRFQNSIFTCDEMEFLPVILDPPRNGSDPNTPAPVTIGTMCPPTFRKIY